MFVLAMLAIALAGCGAEDASEQDGAASAPVAGREPSGTLFVRNARDASLTVVEQEPAQRLLAKLGFVESQRKVVRDLESSSTSVH